VAQAVRQRLDPRRFLDAVTVAILRADERRKDGAVDRIGTLASLQVRNGVQPVLRLFNVVEVVVVVVEMIESSREFKPSPSAKKPLPPLLPTLHC
jgi:hypothetical protein